MLSISSAGVIKAFRFLCHDTLISVSLQEIQPIDLLIFEFIFKFPAPILLSFHTIGIHCRTVTAFGTILTEIGPLCGVEISPYNRTSRNCIFHFCV